MQNQQYQPIGLIDIIQSSTPPYPQDFNPISYQKQDISSQEDYKWIQDFLAPSALVDYSPQNNKPNEDQKKMQIIETLPEFRQNYLDSIETPKRMRSVFHNFQKHLITLLKKIVYIRRIDVISKPAGVRALDLWKIFKQGRDFSKKSLYLVFGVAQSSNDSVIVSLAQTIPDLQKILSKYGCEEIENAQAILRKIVIEKVSLLSKETIQQQCKMAKFQQFYAYFLHFIEQLEGDGLFKRLKKEQKQKVFERNSDLIK